MKIQEGEKAALDLLAHEHMQMAYRLGFVADKPRVVSKNTVFRSVGLIDKLSRKNNENAKQIAVLMCALLWTYARREYGDLYEVLLIFLARMGFSPSGIMIDENYDQEYGVHSPLHSAINEHIITRDSVKYEVNVEGEFLLLTKFQKDVWDSIDNNRLVGVSAPTSAGKSYLIVLKSVSLLLKKPGTVVYIVPTLSLVAQVCGDYKAMLDRFRVSDYNILTTYNVSNHGEKSIYVLTQEKAMAAFSQASNPFGSVRVLVVDEIQNIERVASEEDIRSKTLYDVITEMRFSGDSEHIVISGPRVEGLSSLGFSLFGLDGDEVVASSSPVSSLTYSVLKRGDEYYFRQFACVLDKPFEVKIDSSHMISDFGKQLYRDGFYSYLNYFLGRLSDDTTTIIFSPTVPQSRKTAQEISKAIVGYVGGSHIDSLVAYVKSTVHNDYGLSETISRGVVYHHGKIPSHVRRAVEKALSMGLVKYLVCTTTLMQGVNLPAQNIVIRSPDLFVKRTTDSVQLTNYEFANLRGRAGRLLKDFIGRTFVLEENRFNVQSRQYDLLQDEKKQVSAGYSDKYADSRDEIEESLWDGDSYSETDFPNNFLLTFIRHAVLRHGDEAQYRLRSIGIQIPKDVLDKVHYDLRGLSVSREVCLKNRYWDPLDLEVLSIKSRNMRLATDVHSRDAANVLMNAFVFMRNEMPRYCQRYFKVPEDEGFLLSRCIGAVNWAKERTMRDILSDKFYNTPDRIEDGVAFLQGDVSYGMPMLLRPLYDMLSPVSLFLKNVECGAYSPLTRQLVELGIPRDTSIFIANNYFDSKSMLAMSHLKQRLRNVVQELSFWQRCQVEYLV